MNPDTKNRRRIEQHVRNAPRRVQATGNFALLVGLIGAARGGVAYVAGSTDLGKAALFGLAFLGMLFLSGMGIYQRKRSSFMILLVFGLLVMCGGVLSLLHMLALVVSGRWSASIPHSVATFLGVCHLLASAPLLRNLLSRQTRMYVWGPEQASIQEVREG